MDVAAKALNEQIREVADLLPSDPDHKYGFTCECGCGEMVTLTASEFDRDGGAWLEGHKPK